MTNEYSCNLCGGLGTKIIEESRYYYKTVKCIDCGLVFVTPKPPRELLADAYTEDYFRPWLQEQRRKRLKMWQSRLKRLEKLSKGKGSLLDVGCGDAFFLELAKNDGWLVTGTDISSYAVKHGRDQVGLTIIQGDILEIELPTREFDAVTMWHVLEHTTSPLETLRKLRQIIKDNGVFIIAVPNLDNKLSQWLYRLIKGKRLRLFDPGDRELHLYHFNSETIRLAVEKAGFKVVAVLPDRGIVQSRKKAINHIARITGSLTGRILTDALEIHAIPS
jgi:2-polyprenyl-3-methyl-5-hydroxy-6-metoxy-1,4-benzoquinol methylase